MRSNLAEAQTNVISADFRKTTWGMNRSEVKLAESRYPLSENETYLTYNDRYMELEATIGFHFINDFLVEAGYAFHEVFTDLESYIHNYNKVKLELSSHYGLPIIDKKMGVSEDNSACYIKSCAISENKIFITEWKTRRSIIRLLLVSDKHSTEFGILHISRMEEIEVDKSVN